MTNPPDLDERLALATRYLQELRDVFRSHGLKVKATGTFAAFTIAFVWKQEDHADAILALGRHRDVQLIARSMIEGLCQLKWAAQAPDARAERWRLYAWVHDWRLMRRKLDSGQDVPDAKKLEIEQALIEYGHLFETRRATQAKKRGKPMTDPYVRHWSGKSVAQLCEEIQGDALYTWPYATFSDWHHWSPAGVLQALQAESNKISFPEARSRDVLPSYVTAFQCLYETMALANKTLEFDLDHELQVIQEAFIRDLTPSEENLQN